MSTKVCTLTIDRLRDVLKYDPETGEFTWSYGRPRVVAGAVAGTVTKRGYRNIKIDGVIHQAHRLAWMYVYGCNPPKEIDHINGVCGDNRISNLRLASRVENTQNARIRRDNTSGFKGVHWHKACRKWMAVIHSNNTRKRLGLYATKEEASAAYKAAARKHHGCFARVE